MPASTSEVTAGSSVDTKVSLGRIVVRDSITTIEGRALVCSIAVDRISMFVASVASAMTGNEVVISDAALSAADKIVDVRPSDRTVVKLSAVGALSKFVVGEGRRVVRSLSDGKIGAMTLACESAVVTSTLGVSLARSSKAGKSLTWEAADERAPATSLVILSRGASEA